MLYVLSWRARRQHRRLTGVGYAMLGMTVLTASAWLGGEMVYRHHLAVIDGVLEAQTRPQDLHLHEPSDNDIQRQRFGRTS